MTSLSCEEGTGHTGPVIDSSSFDGRSLQPWDGFISLITDCPMVILASGVSDGS